MQKNLQKTVFAKSVFSQYFANGQRYQDALYENKRESYISFEWSKWFYDHFGNLHKICKKQFLQNQFLANILQTDKNIKVSIFAKMFSIYVPFWYENKFFGQIIKLCKIGMK